MSCRVRATVVVLDIEGTTSDAGFILGDLYDYARPRLGPWIDSCHDDPEVSRAVGQVIAEGGLPANATTQDVVAVLHHWMAEDVKATPLKTLQGLIWADGFGRGELTAHFYDDVIPNLRGWHAAGVRLAVYSSGSVASQRAWFAHSPDGDLSSLIDHFFDTINAGSKLSEKSFDKIAETLQAKPGSLLFLSDRPGELRAAVEAGWQAVALRRPGQPFADADFRDVGVAAVPGFDRLEVSPA